MLVFYKEDLGFSSDCHPEEEFENLYSTLWEMKEVSRKLTEVLEKVKRVGTTGKSSTTSVRPVCATRAQARTV